MKDKIIIAIVSIFFIGMYMFSIAPSINSSNDSFISEENISSPNNKMDYIDYEIPETTITENATIEPSKNTECLASSNNINKLTFSKAFSYYRQCMGSGSTFNWQGKEYTTITAEEIPAELADSTSVKEKNSNEEISITH
tara:strand:+ start:4339 stop:4758 length:420 start_codon:yes stop_codon:yes gene_type:complete